MAIPVMLGVTLGLFYFVPGLGLWIIIGGLLITSVIAGGSPELLVDLPGQKVERQEMTREQQESRFFKVSIVCFFVVAIGALGWSLVYLVKFLLR